MATRSSILAWRIPGMGEPGGLPSMGSHRVGHNWSDLAVAVVMYQCERWTIKKAKHQRIDAFELWCWRRLLRVHWTARSNQSILKEINPKYSLEGLMPKAEASILWPSDAKSRLTGKDPDAGKDWEQEEKRATDDEMVGWHHRLNGHELEQTPGDTEGQGSLACCSPWGCKELDTT